MVNKYSNLSERDKQVTLLERMDAVKTAIENMPTGGGLVEYSINEDGEISKSVIDFKLPSDVKTVDRYALSDILRECQTLRTADLSSLTDINGDHGAYYMFNGSKNLTSVDLSSLTAISGVYGASYMFNNCSGLTSVDLSSLTTISGDHAAGNMFGNCSSLTSVDLSSLTTINTGSGASYMFSGCTSLTSVDLSSLTRLAGYNTMSNAFQNCSSLTSVNLSSLTTLNGGGTFANTFQKCTSLKELRFPSLTENSFYGSTTQFSNIVSGVTGCTIHFPASVKAIVETFTGYPNFGGTNTTVLFDL